VGLFFIWVYGHEGNEMYLRWVLPLRRLTAKLPHALLVAFCHALSAALDLYIAAAKRCPVPMRHYINNVIGRFSRKNRLLVIYDQLNLTYAKYYREREVRDLLTTAGFEDVRLYHRHAYSWSAVCRRPY
jgi:hypothetical protein